MEAGPAGVIPDTPDAAKAAADAIAGRETGICESRLKHFAEADGTAAKPSSAAEKMVIHRARFWAFDVRMGKNDALECFMVDPPWFGSLSDCLVIRTLGAEAKFLNPRNPPLNLPATFPRK